MKSVILLLAFAATCMTSNAQQSVELPEQNGIKLSYQLSKIKGSNKKDQYVVVFTAYNKNDFDLYYAVPMMRQKDSSYKLISFEKKPFWELVIKNSTGLNSLLDNRAGVSGEQTQLTTRKNEVLFKISKGQTMTGDLKFFVKSAQVPVFSNESKWVLRRLDEYDIGINGLFINGSWEVNCGGTKMSLSLTKNEHSQVQLIQLINGKQQVWQMITENIFEKINDKSASLTYNKIGNIFTYTNVDGVICMWTKK